jgi:hypothetical protein
MTDVTTLLALIAGHLVGDFALQTDGLAARKARRVWWLILHVAVVTMVTWLFLGTPAAAPAAGALLGLHLLTDLTKRRFGPRDAGWGPGDGAPVAMGRGTPETISATDPGPSEARGTSEFRAETDTDPIAPGSSGASSGLRWFFLDQAIHVGILLLLWWGIGRFLPEVVSGNHWSRLWGQDYAKALLLVSGFTATVWMLSIVLKFQMAEFAAALPANMISGLPRAGRAVGRLERALIFVFVLNGQPEAVGFVVAAKTIFRIGDLSRRDERAHAEYIMVGTLRSFVYALLVALATRWLLGRLG